MYNKDFKLRKDKSSGYLYFLDREHPLAEPCFGKVYHHRHVASLKIGRWLRKGEHVHHIDGQKDNNDPSNLVVLSSTEHEHLHKGHRKKKECKTCGKMFTVLSRRKKFCSNPCSALGQRHQERPSLEILLQEVKALGFMGTGRKYGVTDNTIRKWIKAGL